MKDMGSLLNKLDTALGKKKSGGKIDFKALDELKKKSFLKLKEGKNNLVFITPEGAEDPFTFRGYHAGLQEVAYYSVPCDHFNKNEDCTVCKVVDDLKAENYDGNKHLWYPIRQQTEYYAPVIVVDSEATIAEGVKWLKLSKTVMTQLTEWLRNLEKDELPFFSDEESTKVIITYDKKAAPMEQYKLDKKSYKGFDAQQLIQWRESLKPVSDFIFSKSQTEITKIVDGYFARVSKEVENQDADDSGNEVEAQQVEKASSKLSFLKK
jgi:hypothetical protein